MAHAKILIVEDELLIAAELERRLTRKGYVVPAMVSCGVEAIQKATECQPDLILMDIHLDGEMDGIEAAKQIRDRFDIPVVYLTAYADKSTLERAKETVPFGYILKPFEERELRVTVDMALSKHQMEKKIRESEERYQSLFESASDAIVTFSLEGMITSVNKGLEVMLGWSRKELIGQHYRKISTPASAILVEECLYHAFAGEPLRSASEFGLVHKEERVVPVEGQIAFLCDEKGRPSGFQAILRDISARKALEQQRADFLAMLTHDIKNPLTVILGYTELQKEAQEQGLETGENWLERIERSARTVQSLVTNYLQLSQIEAGQLTLRKEPLAINDLLYQVVQPYLGEAQLCHIALEFQLEAGLPAVDGDPIALERVVTNLVHNALKFTPQGGRITVSSVRHTEEVMISVANTGLGIAPEEIETIFEKYQQAAGARHQGSVGLGLFIVKTLVEAHGGRVEVVSSLGTGTCFSIFLPAA